MDELSVLSSRCRLFCISCCSRMFHSLDIILVYVDLVELENILHFMIDYCSYTVIEIRIS